MNILILFYIEYIKYIFSKYYIYLVYICNMFLAYIKTDLIASYNLIYDT